jgi:5'-3' exonuclease
VLLEAQPEVSSNLLIHKEIRQRKHFQDFHKSNIFYRHLIGIFNRNIQFMQHGIKAVWVFDGKPPDMKLKLLEKRKENRDKAEEAKEEACEEGDAFRMQ